MPTPVGLSPTAVGLITSALFFSLVARTSESGWLMVIVAGLVATFIVGTVLPMIWLVGWPVQLAGPADATVNRPVTLMVGLPVKRAGLRLRLGTGPFAVTGGLREGETAMTPSHRGVQREVDVELRTAFPLGLVTWRRSLVVTMPRAIEVGPVAAQTDLPAPTTGEASEMGAIAGQAGRGETTRGARDYTIGDPMRWVHWPSTARSGHLMVRELEMPAHSELMVEVDLSGPADRAEVSASEAAGVALAALAGNCPVTLSTREPGGPVIGPVHGPLDVSRRLARAVAGPLDERRTARSMSVVRMDRTGQRWR